MSAAFLYAAAFEGGIVKVGRSTQPHKRIGEHEDRLSCAGIRLLDRYVVECQGDVAQAEAFLIARCNTVAEGCRQREWFHGLLFSAACDFIDEACAMEFPVPDPGLERFKQAIQRAVDHFGGVRPMSEQTGISRAAIYFWLSGDQRVSAEYARRIEEATAGAVTRADLRPDLFGAMEPHK